MYNKTIVEYLVEEANRLNKDMWDVIEDKISILEDSVGSLDADIIIVNTGLTKDMLILELNALLDDYDIEDFVHEKRWLDLERKREMFRYWVK